MERTCIVCGKTFENPYAKTITCSPECSRANRIAKHRLYNALHKGYRLKQEERACPNCGVVFTTRNSRQKFCSDGCRVAFSQKQLQDKNKAARSKGRVCPECGTVFYVLSTAQNGKVYCSEKCRYKHKYKMKMQRIKQLDPKYKNCEICGKKFSSALSPSQKYCSLKCRREAEEQKRKSRTSVKTCEVCGNAFETTNSRRKTCSAECVKKLELLKKHVENPTSSRKTIKTSEQKYSRKCHKCGAPTDNYWCDFCRRKLRASDGAVADGWEFI